METKICSRCRDTKSITEFNDNKNNKDGKTINCTICSNKINENDKKYRQNKNKINEKRRLSYQKNKEKINKRNKKYYFKNKIKINTKSNEYVKNKMKNNLLFKLRRNLHSLILISINNKKYTKKSKTQEILGCSYQEFKIHIESQFENWMDWGNHGLYNGQLNHGWDIDHIIPISSAKSEDDVIRLNHYSNLQPLCSKINRDIKKNN